MRTFTTLLFLLLISGCDKGTGRGQVGFGPGGSDFSKKIVGEYHIHRTSAHQIMIAPPTWTDETQIIPTKIVECDFDSRFVIARQQELQRRSPNDPKDTYMEPAPGKYNYWILDTRIPKAYGPLIFEQFTSQRKTLAVPGELTLKDVYTFKP